MVSLCLARCHTGFTLTQAINVANPAIDRQTGRAGEQARETRRVLNRTMKEVDAVIHDQAAGGGGHSKP
jgi:hypothetical protein